MLTFLFLRKKEEKRFSRPDQTNRQAGYNNKRVEKCLISGKRRIYSVIINGKTYQWDIFLQKKTTHEALLSTH